MVHWIHQWPSLWLCGSPITIDVQCCTMNDFVQRDLCDCVKPISDTKTCRITAPTIPRPSWRDYIEHKYVEMKVRTPEHARHMNKVRSGAGRYGQVCIMQTRLPRTTSILQISSVMWRSSGMYGVKLEVFHDHGFGDVSGEWTAFDVKVGNFCTFHWH